METFKTTLSFILFIIASPLLFVMGALIKYKKVTWLISGYNTMPKEKKEKYDTDKLCKYIGNFLFVLASAWCVIAILSFIFSDIMNEIIIGGLIVLTVILVSGLIYLNTKDRLKK